LLRGIGRKVTPPLHGKPLRSRVFSHLSRHARPHHRGGFLKIT
jgi:hypothetical protein